MAQGSILAQIEGFGRIYHCGDCSNIHVQVGPVSLTLTIGAFLQLAALVNASTASVERPIALSGTAGTGWHN